MDLVLYIAFIVSAAIGTGSSFISDVFFIFSFKNHVLKVHELKMLSRLQFTGLVSASIALGCRLILFCLQFESYTFINLSTESAFILILGIIIISTLTLRRFHLPALIRHQQRHSHLSDVFLDHQDSLVITSALTLSSWFFVLIIISFETKPLLYSFNFVTLFGSYVIATFIFMKFAQVIKGFYSRA